MSVLKHFLTTPSSRSRPCGNPAVVLGTCTRAGMLLPDFARMT